MGKILTIALATAVSSGAGCRACTTEAAEPDSPPEQPDSPPEEDTSGRQGEHVGSIYMWLPGTTWDCTYETMRDPWSTGTMDHTVIAHTWAFTETEVDSNVAEAIVAAWDASSPSIVQTVQSSPFTDTDGAPIVTASIRRRPWLGFGANLALVYVESTEGSPTGIRTRFDRDGDDHMTITYGTAKSTYVIVCEKGM